MCLPLHTMMVEKMYSILGFGVNVDQDLRGLLRCLRSRLFPQRSLSGVDDTVSPRTLCDISQEFAFVEPLV